MSEITKVYVQLLEEGSPAMRGTNALILGNGTYKLLATPYYNPNDEIWEFPPDTIVKCELRKNYGEEILFAIKKAK